MGAMLHARMPAAARSFVLCSPLQNKPSRSATTGNPARAASVLRHFSDETPQTPSPGEPTADPLKPIAGPVKPTEGPVKPTAEFETAKIIGVAILPDAVKQGPRRAVVATTLVSFALMLGLQLLLAS